MSTCSEPHRAYHDHQDSTNRGRTAIRHGGHAACLHDGHLHHPHEDHCDNHGPVETA
ncbi:hypothetical protein LMG27174_06778 [Paraburkholderia rhynchosiae]|uniref:Uncharacterized protein n=1 Tax=Paraburkholderia rhynchosiae TaxID=487049 RepID=A0A6J5CPJ0_9BURK|nr:hypothetical protein LMG27174_06778 [Paraburkholderia rhynchosiae]